MDIAKGLLFQWGFWQFIITIAGFALLRFNDLFHVGKSLEEIKINLKEIQETQVRHGEAIAEIQGRCEAFHTKTKGKTYRRSKA